MLEDRIAFLLGQAVYRNRIARIGIQDFLACQRVSQKGRVTDRRTRVSLFFAQGRARATRARAHHVPKFIEVMRDCFAGQSHFQVIGKILIDSVHISELRGPQWHAISMRYGCSVQNVRQCDDRRIGHISVPGLSCIFKAERLAVNHHVRKNHDFRKSWCLRSTARTDVKRTKLLAECFKLSRCQRLFWKLKHTMAPK